MRSSNNQKIEATLVVMKKTEAESKGPLDPLKGILGGELVGNKISLQLVSADKTGDPENKLGGKIGEQVYLENWDVRPNHGEIPFIVYFDWNEDFGKPGAILVDNAHHDEFYLKTVTLNNVPCHQDPIHFICDSWVYNSKKDGHRVFFSNKPYLPHETPKGLLKYREEELRTLRGNGKDEKLEERDRVYDYAVYNDLGNPDKSLEYHRQVLGGSSVFPYPRRGRTSRPRTKSDPNTESRAGGENDTFKIYVPRDEQFSRRKKSDFNNSKLKSFITHQLFNQIPDFFSQGRARDEFDSFQDVENRYGSASFPKPQVIKDNCTGWRTDEEFAREMLAGVNPLVIRCLKEFPPTSKLDPYLYVDQNSTITEEDTQCNLEGLTVQQALQSNRLFILDHHDTVMPYLRKINSDTSTRTYASRTILFLKDDGTLKPLAIELSLPDKKGDRWGADSMVYTPAQDGIEGYIWQFAKAFVAVNDCGHHQLISHWLNTHAVLEPFIIATNRQLSVVHPIHKLLRPHYRDTMTINALAREVLVNAGGLVEKTFYPGKYALEMSSIIYKSWNFLDQALPTDLKKRGMAVDDVNAPHGLRLMIEDYPFAVDGLKIWFALEKWVSDYCFFYYGSDAMVRDDRELQAWWKELVEVGHGDKKDEPWWPKMQSRKELIECCTIIIWIASALHASVNFGQYAYGGFPPNRPTLSRRLMPKPGTPEYAELEKSPEKAFFKTMTSLNQSLTGISLIETLSKHFSDEVYLGQRPSNWTADKEPQDTFEEFRNELKQIEKEIENMNKDKQHYKNRTGPVNVPYTLLCPEGDGGLSGKGIPNSISI